MLPIKFHQKKETGTEFGFHKKKDGKNSIADRAKEGISWSKEIKAGLAYSKNKCIAVAEVYFAINDDQLHADDVVALDALVKSLIGLLYNKFQVKLICVGGADYRGSFFYNMDLGKRRAHSVRDLLLDRLPQKNLSVVAETVGETMAIQPVSGENPSLDSIMKDRKVTVVLGEFVPPVALSAVGNWIHNSTFEKYEINNGGRVVAMPHSQEWAATTKESRIKRQEFDPLLPTVLLKTNCFIKKINNQSEVYVECRVVHQPSRALLFMASAHTNVHQKLREQYHYQPAHSDIKRKIYPGASVPQHHKVEEIDISAFVNSRAAYLVDPLYAQLKGAYRSICDRVEKMLKTMQL